MKDRSRGLPQLEPFDIEEAFSHQEEELRAALKRGTGITNQPSIAGDTTEEGWREMLSNFLPSRYGVATGKVVDSQGQQSEQIDVIIHDTFSSPLMFSIGNHKFVPAESVYAILEIKQTLEKRHLEAAARKAESVRRLHRTSSNIPNHFGKQISKDLDQFPILAGLLASRSTWKVPFENTLRRHLSEQTARQAIDLGCALESGAFDVRRLEEASDHLRLELATSTPGRALSFFALRLLHRLQQQGSVGAIDYEEYSAPILAE